MSKIVIGVMGPGENATKENIECAYKIGKLIAEKGWVLLTGGRNSGVMDAACKGAKDANGLTLGILPTSEPETVSSAVDIAVFTDMKSARNNINILSSKVVIACGMEAGTASEVCLALKIKKEVILINQDEISKNFFKKIGKEKVTFVEKAEEVIQKIESLI